MKKVLVTGGAGFVGANLIRKLLVFPGFNLFVIEKKDTNLWRIKDIVRRIKIKKVDLEDFNNLSKTINQIKPEFIVHLASYGVYPSFQKDVNQMINTNITGTVNLINSVKNHQISSFINASTCFVYKEKKSKIKENNHIAPLNCYAVTKLAAELLLKKIALNNNMPIINLRIFTPYGYYEDVQRLLPTIILNALKDREIKLSSPDNVRDFIFIDDLINLFVKIIRDKKISKYRGEIFNVGSGQQHSVAEIVSIVESLLGKKLNVVYGGKGRYRELQNLVANTSKAKKKLGWNVCHSTKSGINKTIKWFKNNIKLYEK